MFIQVTNRQIVSLSDNTQVDVATYDILTAPEGQIIESGLMESQLFHMGLYYCWRINSISNLMADTFSGYFSPNVDAALPKPKGSNNPGGSPVKY